jgi:GAF domain-containing protein
LSWGIWYLSLQACITNWEIDVSQNRQILDEIAGRIQDLVRAETSIVALAESEGEILHYAAAIGKHAAGIIGKRGATATSGLCGVAFAGRQSVLVDRAEGDRRLRQDWVKALGIQTALAVPLSHEDELLGVLMVLNRTDGRLFDEQAEQILVAYASQAAALVRQFMSEESTGSTHQSPGFSQFPLLG